MTISLPQAQLDTTSSLHTIVLQHCATETARAAGWYIEASAQQHSWWIFVHHRHAIFRPQGWKLHVSAGVASAEMVLKQALPVLLAEDADFKVITSLRRLDQLNNGEAGLSQIGKCITVYPNDDEQAIRLAVALDTATRGLRGPIILSDQPLAPDSLVHYRYGGFSDQDVQLPSGKLLPAITNPEGVLIPDRREPGHYAPDWAVDPFVAAGVVTPRLESDLLFNKRFLVVTTISSSPRGTVARAVDITVPQRCILKRAARDAQMHRNGQDARDYLRNSATLLRRLAPDPRFPAVYDLFEYNGDLILAMEDVVGKTLADYVGDLTARGHFVAQQQIIMWARELAAVLGHLHSQGLVYRDLKSTNVVITTDHQLRLIDFDGVCDTLAAEVDAGLGTSGYMSPQQRAGMPPTIGDDIYGLGALCYFLATGAEPSLAPNPDALLDRSPEQINPALSPTLSQFIRCCLDPDSTRRYTSIVAADAALAMLNGDNADAPSPAIQESPVLAAQASADTVEDLIFRLGTMLCSAARRACSGEGWGRSPQTPMPLGLADGAAGIVLGLSELVAAFDQHMHRDTLEALAHWLREALPSHEPLLPGLAAGMAGIGLALLRAGQSLRDDQLIKAAAELGRRIAALPYTTPDLAYGTAGRLRFHLMLYNITAESEHLQVASTAGNALVATQEDDGHGGAHWLIPAGYDKLSGTSWLNYAHGSAGIGDALLDLFDTTGCERFLSAAGYAALSLERLAISTLHDGSGAIWPKREGDELAGCSWWYGAAGIGHFLLHAAELGIVPQAAELAARAARAVAQGLRSSGPTLAHGLAGGIDLQFAMAQATGETSYRTKAYLLIDLLKAFVLAQEHVQPFTLPTMPTAGYLTGLAGLPGCLLPSSAGRIHGCAGI